MMFLKHPYGLGYASLCREVAGLNLLVAVSGFRWVAGAAPLDVGQADRAPRRERDRAAERGAAGQGGGGQTWTPARSPRAGLGKPVEFGYKAQVVDNTGGIVLDHGVDRGNTADAPLLAPAIGRIKTLLNRAPARGHRRPRATARPRWTGH